MSSHSFHNVNFIRISKSRVEVDSAGKEYQVCCVTLTDDNGNNHTITCFGKRIDRMMAVENPMERINEKA